MLKLSSEFWQAIQKKLLRCKRAFDRSIPVFFRFFRFRRAALFRSSELDVIREGVGLDDDVPVILAILLPFPHFILSHPGNIISVESGNIISVESENIIFGEI